MIEINVAMMEINIIVQIVSESLVLKFDILFKLLFFLSYKKIAKITFFVFVFIIFSSLKKNY